MESHAWREGWWAYPAERVVVGLASDAARGLTEAEAAKRLQAHGGNTVQEAARAGRLKLLLRQFASPLILVLTVAGIVTLALADFGDAAFIFIAVVVNAGLGFFQEDKAERALAALRGYLKPKARVVREGRERAVDAEVLVPGDLVRLAAGERVPADARILSAQGLSVDEAVLTGESLPVGKRSAPVAADASVPEQKSMVFAGTLVSQGTAMVLVCRTGAETEFGRIAAALAGTEAERTPLQAAILRFSVLLSAGLGALTVLVFGIGIAAGYPVLDMFLTAVAIAVSAIPEGLPVAMTVILAVGVERMAKRKGVVRKLVAAEALGSATVILTDKTGTLTQAKMALARLVPIAADETTLLRRAVAVADVRVENPEDDPAAWRMGGGTMEKALVRSLALRGHAAADLLGRVGVEAAVPFDPVRKCSAALLKEGTRERAVFFGAPEALLAACRLPASEHAALARRISRIADSGARVLAVASGPASAWGRFQAHPASVPPGLSFDGLAAFRDPVRAEAGPAIARARDAGVRTVMMTGDHRGTAVAVAREVGLPTDGDAVLDATELASLSDEALRERLPRLSVVARVAPLDKLRIARLFQMGGDVVAMTGDGINDAPSIKRADIGIAMGSGTDVARSVADLVLLDDNFETIVAAIEEGRQIVGNIRKVLVYLLSNVTDGLILIGGSLLMGLPLPFNPLQILWVNFFTDSFPAVAFAFESEPGILARGPRDPRAHLFDPLMRFLVLTIGVSTSALLFVAYAALLRWGFDAPTVRTFVFAAFGTYTLAAAFSVRSLERSLWSYAAFSNPYLNAGSGIGIALMALAVYAPPLQRLFGTMALPWPWILAVGLVGALNILLIETAKWAFRRHASSAYAP